MKSKDVEELLSLLIDSLKDFPSSNNLIYNRNIKVMNRISNLLIVFTHFRITSLDDIIDNQQWL